MDTRILVIDGQGGQLGSQLVKELLAKFSDIQITAVGTNSAATAAMLKAGADQAATGENAIRVCAARADIILAPIGMVLADAMLGEVTAEMAVAIGRSPAHKILVPMSRCQLTVAGIPPMTAGEAIEAAVQEAVRRITAAK